MAAVAIPILISTDTRRAAQYYEKLGFTVANYAGYIICRRGGAELHVSTVDEIPEDQVAAAYIRVDDLDEWFNAFNAAVGGLEPPQETDWGMREFYLVDEDQNLIKVGAEGRN
ncbi:MAG: hypothetical protein J0H82_24190 [Alphaproteobacteria bacterium]|jgi:hypothetical protein|nr:hypothetical protein [Alphaproteobacteria bacterium]